MSEILMCDKCKEVFSKTGRAISVEVTFTSANEYGYGRSVDKEYDLCGECAKKLLNEFEAPAALETGTVRL